MRHSRLARRLLAPVLALAPIAAMACACCGQPDTWSVQQVAHGGHEWDVLERLRPGPGRARLFTDADGGEESLAVTAVDRDGGAWRFRTAAGDLVFRGSQAMERRLVDARLILDDDTAADGVAPIYQELVLPGALLVPADGDSAPVAVAAHLVLRGIAGMCVDAENFSGWLMRGSGGPVRVSGSGGMLAPAAAAD